MWPKQLQIIAMRTTLCPQALARFSTMRVLWDQGGGVNKRGKGLAKTMQCGESQLFFSNHIIGGNGKARIFLVTP